MTAPAQPKSGGLLALLSFGNFIIGMGAFVVIGIVSPIADGLGVAKAAVGAILTIYALAYAIASPIVLVALAHLLASERLARPLTPPSSIQF